MLYHIPPFSAAYPQKQTDKLSAQPVRTLPKLAVFYSPSNDDVSQVFNSISATVSHHTEERRNEQTHSHAHAHIHTRTRAHSPLTLTLTALIPTHTRTPALTNIYHKKSALQDTVLQQMHICVCFHATRCRPIPIGKFEKKNVYSKLYHKENP